MTAHDTALSNSFRAESAIARLTRAEFLNLLDSMICGSVGPDLGDRLNDALLPVVDAWRECSDHAFALVEVEFGTPSIGQQWPGNAVMGLR